MQLHVFQQTRFDPPDFKTQRGHDSEVGLHHQRDICGEPEQVGVAGGKALYGRGRTRPGRPRQHVLGQHILGAAAHELDALSGQIAQGSFRGRMDIAAGQDAQPQHVRQVCGVGLVVAVLKPGVGFQGDGIGKFDVVPFGHHGSNDCVLTD